MDVTSSRMFTPLLRLLKLLFHNFDHVLRSAYFGKYKFLLRFSIQIGFKRKRTIFSYQFLIIPTLAFHVVFIVTVIVDCNCIIDRWIARIDYKIKWALFGFESWVQIMWWKVLFKENCCSVRFVSFRRQLLIFWQIWFVVLIRLILEKWLNFAIRLNSGIFLELFGGGLKYILLFQGITLLNGTGIKLVI